MGAALMVLKIIGIIILLVLAIIVLALILVLAVPIKYGVQAEKYENIKARINAVWLFKLLNITVEFENKELSYNVKVFGKVLVSSQKEEKSEEKEEKTAKAEPPKARELVFEEKVAEEEIEPAKKEADISTEAENQTDEEEKKRIEFEEYKKSCTKAVVRRVKIKEMEEAPESKEEKPKEDEKESKSNALNKDYFIKMPFSEKKALLGCAVRLIKRVLKGVLPKNLYVNAKVGSGDPATTGYILAASGVIKGTVFKDVSITGDFEKAGFEGEGRLKGKITIGYLAYSALCFALARPIRKIIILFLKGRGVKK